MHAKHAFLTLVLATVLAVTVRAESYLVVKIVDRDGTEHAEVMTPEQIRVMQADIQLETKLYPRVVAQAREAWMKDKENTKPFPGGAIRKRSVSPIGAPFDDEAKATEKRDKITERNAAKAADEADKLERRLRDRYPGDKRKEKMADMDAKEAERKALDEKARTVYEKELAQVKSATTPAGGAGTAAP
ncbi:MAG: hypothetical protein K8T26_01670 [Lentisphaerae bacterium]|nr:hypothetical protein [Lentisphaerota bacterium]